MDKPVINVCVDYIIVCGEINEAQKKELKDTIYTIIKEAKDHFKL